MITKTNVRKGNIGNKKGWCFEIYFNNTNYPGLISALYTRKYEAENALDTYYNTGEFETYGTAEK